MLSLGKEATEGLSLMEKGVKAFIIHLKIIVISSVVSFIFGHIFYSKGLYAIAPMASWIPGFALGLYILFGRYAYFRGNELKRGARWLVGFALILFVPMISLAQMSSERVERERRERQHEVIRRALSRPRQQQLDSLYESLLQFKSTHPRSEANDIAINFGRNRLIRMLDETINDPNAAESELRHAKEMLDRLNEAN